MPLQVTITAPQSSAVAEYINPETCSFSGKINEAGTCSMTLTCGPSRYADETDATQPVQVNSLVQIVDTETSTTYWTGYIVGLTRQWNQGGSVTMRLDAVDPWARIGNCICYGFENSTADYTNGLGTNFIGDVIKYEVTDTIPRVYDRPWDDVGINTVFYPDPTETSNYFPLSGDYRAAHTTLGLNIDSNDAVVVGSTAYEGFAPVGFCQFATTGEIFYYNDYRANDDGDWVFISAGSFRGVFGTTAQSHTAGEVINQIRWYDMVDWGQRAQS